MNIIHTWFECNITSFDYKPIYLPTLNILALCIHTFVHHWAREPIEYQSVVSRPHHRLSGVLIKHARAMPQYRFFFFFLVFRLFRGVTYLLYFISFINSIDESMDVCHDRSKWKTVLSAYPDKSKAWSICKYVFI